MEWFWLPDLIMAGFFAVAILAMMAWIIVEELRR